MINKITLLITSLMFLGIGMVMAESVTLPNGKVVDDPYILERHPDGIIVGHRTGCLKLKYKDMPPKLQKEFNYDPAAAQAYEKKSKETQLAYAKRDAEQKARYEKNVKKAIAENREELIFKQKQNIERLRENLKIMEEKLPKMERRINEDRMSAVHVASGSSDSGNSNLTSLWGWGGNVSSRNNSAQRSRVIRHSYSDVKKLDKEYDRTRTEMVNLKLQIEREERTLAAMVKKSDTSESEED